jgi:hypothetical protein
LVVAAVLMVCPRFGRGATVDEYQGADGGLWSVAGNWSLNTVPNSNLYDVLIGKAPGVTVLMNGETTINNLAVTAGNTLSLQYG